MVAKCKSCECEPYLRSIDRQIYKLSVFSNGGPLIIIGVNDHEDSQLLDFYITKILIMITNHHNDKRLVVV